MPTSLSSAFSQLHETLASPGRRRALCTLSALLMATWVPGCGGHEPLRFAAHAWAGYEFLFLARTLGWLDEENVRLVETSSASDSMHALFAGLVDGAALTLDEVVRVRANGLPLRVIAIVDISAGADALVSRPDITTLADLSGKRIGVENTGLGAVMLSAVLTAAHLPPEAVEVVYLPIDRHEEAWHAASVDALITFSPVLDRLEKRGARRLFDSRQIPDRIFDVLTITPQAWREKKDAARQLVSGHFQALHYFFLNPQDAIQRMANRLRVPVNEVGCLYQGLHLPGIEENLRFLQGQPSPLETAAQSLLALLIATGVLTDTVSLDGLTTPALLATTEP